MPVLASWQKRFLDYLTARPSLKKVRVQKIFSSLQLNCSGARRRYNIQELKKAEPEFCSPEKLGEEGSFGLVRCLDGTDRTRERGLTGGGRCGYWKRSDCWNGGRASHQLGELL